MKIYLYFILHILILLFLFGCVNFEDDAPSFAIYFLKDSTLTMKDIEDKNIDELKLSNNAWLTQDDIEFYDWSSHCIYLKKDKTFLFPNWENNNFNEFPPEWADKPFVVVANGNRCYMGYFESFFSHYWKTPLISDGFNSMYPSDVLFIDWWWLYHDYPQNNPNIKNALMNAGIYHGGISVTFDVTDAILNIEDADTSTITYKFTITNNDEDDLYVIDPDKTGSDLFHWFTNGLTFQDINTGKIYEPRWRKYVQLPSTDYWSSDWFTKLKSGHSIQRTVVLKGYPYFPTGKYMFQFKYNGQISGMEKEVRELADGRYWLGPTRSNIMVMVLEAKDDSLSKKNVTRKHFEKSNQLRIFEMNNPFINEYLHITLTQQEFELKRR
ncbi:MAG: hypothetical protein U9N76_06320 [Candidatus Marinimicrobia bacterium]|nr:hypothetical protein [Candidatus Neomarinimicrobiota bacterium]